MSESRRVKGKGVTLGVVPKATTLKTKRRKKEYIKRKEGKKKAIIVLSYVSKRMRESSTEVCPRT